MRGALITENDSQDDESSAISTVTQAYEFSSTAAGLSMAIEQRPNASTRRRHTWWLGRATQEVSEIIDVLHEMREHRLVKILKEVTEDEIGKKIEWYELSTPHGFKGKIADFE